MSRFIVLTVFLSLLAVAAAFRAVPSGNQWVRNMKLNQTPLVDAAIELTGRLDPSKNWDVTLVLNGEEKVVSISEGQSVLECAEKQFKGVESSCRNGVCTTCASLLLSPSPPFSSSSPPNFLQAVNCLGKAELDAGFVCACQTYVTGPGVKILLGQQDAVYETQWGEAEKSYTKK